MEGMSWLGWVVAALLGVFVIRGTVHFDLNKWLKDRRKHRLDNARRLCPHVEADMVNGQPAVKSLFESPFGTVASQCQQCGVVFHSRQSVDDNTRYWAEHPVQLLERLDRFKQLAEKAGYTD